MYCDRTNKVKSKVLITTGAEINLHITIEAKVQNFVLAGEDLVWNELWFSHRSEEPRNCDSEEPDHGQRRCLQVHSQQ